MENGDSHLRGYLGGVHLYSRETVDLIAMGIALKRDDQTKLKYLTASIATSNMSNKPIYAT